MGILDIFKPVKKAGMRSWAELGGYQSIFTTFGADAYHSEIVRSCVRPLAEFTSKAHCKCSDERIARIMNERPNVYMSGRDFLQKVRTRVEIFNTCMIYIQRDDRARPIGFYPVPYSSFQAKEYANGLFIEFSFASGQNNLVVPWEDIAVVRKDYNKSDIAGDSNYAILNTLDLISTTDQGMANAIKATANLRGLLKSTKAMLSPDAIKAQKEQFVADYLSLSNQGGIAALDATQDFTPISMSPVTATYEQMKELRENVYRYFGVNDNIVMSNMKPEEIEAFYELRVEPFLCQLSTELCSKIYPAKAGAPSYKNYLVYEADKLQFASLDKKIAMFSSVVLYGGMTVNEWRAGCNMSPIEGGDELIRRLDAAPVEEEKKEDE